MKRLIALLMLSFGFLMLAPSASLAGSPAPAATFSCTGTDTSTGNTTTSVGTTVDLGCATGHGLIIDLLLGIVKFLGGLVGLLVVLMIIIGGIQYITAGGNPKATQAAKSRISNAIIALVLYILMFGILAYLIPGAFSA